MKRYIIPTLALGFLVSAAIAQDKPDLTNPKQRTSYAIGLSLGERFKAQELDLDAKTLSAGIADAMAGKPALTKQETAETLAKFNQDMMAKQQEKMAKQAEQDKVDAPKNLKEGEAFLAENAKKEGVKTTASGLQYKVLKPGTGATPKATDVVKVSYRGTLIDGTVFDSTEDEGEPITHPVNGFIPGWTEALQMMKVGAKWRLFIPAKLAYGDRRAGDKIGPNSTLIFDMDLLDIEKPDQGN